MTKVVSACGSAKPPGLPRTIVTAQGGQPLDRLGFRQPMYQHPAETVELLAMAIGDATGHPIRWARAVESGVVEEFAVVADDGQGRRLICRIWPVFFAFERRVEYQLYEAQPGERALVATYLGLLAQANGAKLIDKTNNRNG